MILRSPPNDEGRGIGNARLESRLVPLRSTWIPATLSRGHAFDSRYDDPFGLSEEMEPHFQKEHSKDTTVRKFMLFKLRALRRLLDKQSRMRLVNAEL
jgi:hypothetical protein